MSPARSIEEYARVARSGPERYHEFLRVPALSVGVYVLPPVSVDGQSPHAEDEIYYVHRGRAMFRQGPEERPIRSGEVLFVPAGEPHHFHTIEEELVLLVVFAPAESSPTGPRPDQ